MAAKAQWTVLTYIAAHNNLHALGEQSFLQILNVGSSQAVAHGLLLDGQHGAARYLVGDAGKVLQQEQLGDFDSGDPGWLAATAKWLFQQRPAERYGLVLWSHGTGWQPAEIEAVARSVRGDAGVGAAEAGERSAAPGSQVLFRSSLAGILAADSSSERAILFDDGTGHSLDTLALNGVVRELAEAIGQPLDFLGLDACLMASAEVAYEIRRSVRCLAASEELVPGHSWPYAVIYGGLRDRPEQTAADLSSHVVRAYTDFYTERPPAAGDVTKVALDLTGAEALATAVRELALALRADLAAGAGDLWRAQRETERQETLGGRRRDSKFSYHLWDLGSLAARLAASGSNDAVRDAAEAVGRSLEPGGPLVLAEGHLGAWFDGIAGLTVYTMPPGKQRVTPSYSELAFSRDTGWGEWLTEYHAAFG